MGKSSVKKARWWQYGPRLRSFASGKIVYRTKGTWKRNCKVVQHGKWECWEWIHSYGGDGRGVISGEHAARFALRLFKGELKNHALHKCDNRRCVRPSHLYDGTHQRNMRDASERGAFTAEECARRSTAMKKLRREINPQVAAAASKRMKKLWSTSAWRKKRSVTARSHAKKLWKDPKYRAMMAKARKKRRSKNADR